MNKIIRRIALVDQNKEIYRNKIIQWVAIVQLDEDIYYENLCYTIIIDVYSLCK